MKLILFSQSEMGFWSNKQGWVTDAASATVFTKTQAKKANLPITKGSDAIWIQYDKQLVFDHFGEQLLKELSDKEAVKLAQEAYRVDGECEVDDNAKTSRGNEAGCYVQAWVWIYWPEVKAKEIKL
jgi:hypothetical protein